MPILIYGALALMAGIAAGIVALSASKDGRKQLAAKLSDIFQHARDLIAIGKDAYKVVYDESTRVPDKAMEYNDVVELMEIHIFGDNGIYSGYSRLASDMNGNGWLVWGVEPAPWRDLRISMQKVSVAIDCLIFMIADEGQKTSIRERVVAIGDAFKTMGPIEQVFDKAKDFVEGAAEGVAKNITDTVKTGIDDQVKAFEDNVKKAVEDYKTPLMIGAGALVALVIAYLVIRRK